MAWRVGGCRWGEGCARVACCPGRPVSGWLPVTNRHAEERQLKVSSGFPATCPRVGVSGPGRAAVMDRLGSRDTCLKGEPMEWWGFHQGPRLAVGCRAGEQVSNRAGMDGKKLTLHPWVRLGPHFL